MHPVISHALAAVGGAVVALGALYAYGLFILRRFPVPLSEPEPQPVVGPPGTPDTPESVMESATLTLDIP